MYISSIRISNFRNFKEQTINFNDGMNVIIGHNNAGKTNLLKALSLVLDSEGSKRLLIDDFHKHMTLAELQSSPPKINIVVNIKQSENEDAASDDLATVGGWLIKLEEPYEACLTYSFFLPAKEHSKYGEALKTATDVDHAWKIIRHDFLRLFVNKIWGGNALAQNQAEAALLQKFDFQFLNAIRDVERDMLSGRNTLLRDVLDFFIDYEIKNDKVKSEDEKKDEIKLRKIDFSEKAKVLIEALQSRMHEGKTQILSYAQQTGASFEKSKPNFEGSISDVELFSALNLIVEYETGIKIPATHNGLGYNNLIFMSMLLAKMQVNADGEYLGSNSKVFPILVIEEPEAHLHPSMQYQFLKFLKGNLGDKVRQIFVTSHSTQITSSVLLDEIICLHSSNGIINVGYPGLVFSNGQSKKYVQRFLDATKSDILFAQKTIFVEGIAEQLLLSLFAEYMGKSLEKNHIVVVNVGGRYFDHFLKLFDTTKPNTIDKKIVCITDRDPVRKIRPDGDFVQCYPFEYGLDSVVYDYSDNASKVLSLFASHPNCKFFSQDQNKGKTFEYELAWCNPNLDILITGSMSNQTEVKKLMDLYSDAGKGLNDFENAMRNGDEKTRIFDGLRANTAWSDDEKKRAVIASRYLNSISKGENALELLYALEENLKKKGTSGYKDFVIPSYIEDAINWICS